jgi:hypothetical protein
MTRQREASVEGERSTHDEYVGFDLRMYLYSLTGNRPGKNQHWGRLGRTISTTVLDI